MLIPVELSDIYSTVSGELQSFEFCLVSGTACALHVEKHSNWRAQRPLANVEIRPTASIVERGMLTKCVGLKKCDWL